MSETGNNKPKCFMAMPITTHADQAERYAGDEEHWKHVMESLFEAAIREAGFEPVRPVAQGSHLIHGMIIRHLSTAELVLVDLSSHNPNVFFELGVRTSLNLPIALVRDEHTDIPFDTSGINTHTYDSNLRGWEIQEQQRRLAEHIRQSHESCGGQNPLWRQFGLTIRASEPDANESPLEAKVDILTNQLMRMQDRMEHDRLVAMEENARKRDMSMAEMHARQGDVVPAEMFAEALNRQLGSRVANDVEILSGREALVKVDGNASPDDLLTVRRLADRYGVDIQMTQSGLRIPGPGSSRKRSTPLTAEARSERDRQLGKPRPETS